MKRKEAYIKYDILVNKALILGIDNKIKQLNKLRKRYAKKIAELKDSL